MAGSNPYAINLFEDEEKEEITDPAVTKRNALIASIIEGNVSIELVKDCEGCGEALRKPMLLTTDRADDTERDSSVFCNPCAK